MTPSVGIHVITLESTNRIGPCTVTDTVQIGVTGAESNPPSVPTGLAPSAVSPTQVDLTWNASTDDSGGMAVPRVPQRCSRRHADGHVAGEVGLAAATAYIYRVSAVDIAHNESALSQAISVSTAEQPPDTEAPSIPSDVSATTLAFNQVEVSWTASSDNVGVRSYRIYRADLVTPVATVLGNRTSYVDAGLTADTTYVYTVTAVDAAGNDSDESSPATTTTFSRRCSRMRTSEL